MKAVIEIKTNRLTNDDILIYKDGVFINVNKNSYLKELKNKNEKLEEELELAKENHQKDVTNLTNDIELLRKLIQSLNVEIKYISGEITEEEYEEIKSRS